MRGFTRAAIAALSTQRIHGYGLAGIVACALSLAACGSSNSNGSTGSNGNSSISSSSSTNGAAASSALPATNVAKGTPVSVGLEDPSIGAEAIASTLPASQAAVAYINNDLGGIGGHPLKLVVCNTDSSASMASSCANTFVQDKVAAVFDGYDISMGSGLPTLTSAGIPVIGQLSENSATNTDTKDSFYFAADESAVAIGSLQAFAKEGKKSVAEALPDVPVAHTYANDFLAPISKELSLAFTAVYYEPTSPNLTVTATTLKAKNPDVAGLSNSPSQAFCNQFIQALRSSGYTNTALASTCTGFLSALGSQAANVAMFSDVWLPQMAKYAPAAIQANLKTAAQFIGKYQPTSKQDYYSYAVFSGLVSFVRALNSVHGTTTSAGIKAGLLKVKDLPTFLGGTDTCNRTIWPDSSACGNQIVVAVSQGDGTLKPIGGGMITVNSQLLPK